MCAHRLAAADPDGSKRDAARQPAPAFAADGDSAVSGPGDALPVGVVRRLVDFAALTRPRVTALVVFTTLGGLYLARGAPPPSRVLAVLLGTVLIVGGANTLNQFLERDSDARMCRTRRRPLPSGRLSPASALWFGVTLAALSLPVLVLGVNPLTAALGVLAFASYVFVYTPMKRRSPAALLVGAVPGAIPPLMGWTAATDRLELPGLLLSAVLFVWQVPHVLAFTIYAADDFARGGLRVLPVVRGVPAARRRILVFSAALVPASVALVPIGVAGRGYLVAALVAGAVFFAWSVWGLRRNAGRLWARSLFLASLAYLTVLFVVLAVEGRSHG